MSVAEKRPGILFILIGPGGVGKNAILGKTLMQTKNLRQLPTATTRPMRPTEQQGREHLFVSPQEFKNMIKENALIEHQEVHEGLYYGVPRLTVEDAIRAGEDLIADIDVLGAQVIREAYPQNTFSVFIAPPSWDALEDRLQTRNASVKDMEDRLGRLPMEMRYAPLCDYVIINDDVNTASDELLNIIRIARRELSLPVAGFPAHHVAYQVKVTPVYNGEALQTSADPETAQPLALLGALKPGTDPADAALSLIQTHFRLAGLDEEADAAAIRPETLSSTPSVTCTHDPQTNTYTYLYDYVYHLSDDIALPQGWHLKSQQRINA